MTEQEWLTCTNPEPMLEYLRGKVSDRKLRLFAVACCRHLLQQIPLHSWDQEAVEVAERYADGKSTAAELTAAANATTPDWTAAFACADAASLEHAAVDAAIYSADNAAHAVAEHVAFQADLYNENNPIFANGKNAECKHQSCILHDIFGNPFRPVTLDPAWLTPTVKALAAAVYEERTFDRLPILADALEDADCSDADILSHCRQPGVHVRGCWALDLVLGKE